MRVLLADGHASVRSALRLLLEQEEGLEIAGEAGDSLQLIDLAARSRPDIVLLDWGLTHGDALTLVAALRHLLPRVRLLVLSGRPEARREAEDAGLAHFVSKNAFSEDLLEAVRHLACQGHS